MIKVERFINQLMTSNCYIVWDEGSHHCVVIDPGSEQSLREIAFIEANALTLDYVFLTHEHTDHTWGVNALCERFAPKVVCSDECRTLLPSVGNMYFRLYYDDPNYSYTVKEISMVYEDWNNVLEWNDHTFHFLPTPGHSIGCVCIMCDNMCFSGDTLMKFKLYANKRTGSKQQLQATIQQLVDTLPQDTIVYPGHGDIFKISECKIV